MSCQLSSLVLRDSDNYDDQSKTFSYDIGKHRLEVLLNKHGA